MSERTYFYVFLVPNATQLESDLAEVFGVFEKRYAQETQVFYYFPDSFEFRPGLKGFGVRKVPGFAISDTLYEIKEGFHPNPFISADRTFLEGRNRDDLFNLVRDWHEVALAEKVLRLGRDKVLEQSRRLFGKVWEEVREVVQVVPASSDERRQMSTEMHKKIQAGMGFTDEQMAKAMADPYRKAALEAGPLMVRRKIVAEVVEAKNCAAHPAGTKYIIRANGVIRATDLAPDSTMCISLLFALAPTAQVIFDRLAQGQDPKDNFVYYVHCPDVGVDCGGYGTALARVTVE